MAVPPLAPIATPTNEPGLGCNEPVLGRYELTSELLGEGGYGRVVLAHDISTTPRGRVAAKVLELSSGLTPAQVQRELDAHRAVQKGEVCEGRATRGAGFERSGLLEGPAVQGAV